MPVLPLELYRHIVEDIVDDVDDSIYCRHLSTISLSCRLLRHEAQRVLFRDSGKLHTTTAGRRKAIFLMDSIISSPDRLALYVKIFSITFDDGFHPNSDETTAIVQKLASALEAMRKLTLLDVVQSTASIPSLPNILQHAHFKLTSFTWSGYSDTVPEATDVQIDFLRRQDTIDHLQMPGFIDENTLKSIAGDILPCLQSLCAPYSSTEILLPGKEKITFMRWTVPRGDPSIPLHQNSDALAPFHPETISKELGRIRYLSYDTGDSTVPVGPNIRRIAPWLTSLVCLDTCREDIKQLEAFQQLPRLEILVLNAGASARSRVPKVHDMIKVAISCKSLEHIDIEHDHRKISRFAYDHSSKESQHYTIDESEWYLWVNDFDIFDD